MLCRFIVHAIGLIFETIVLIQTVDTYNEHTYWGMTRWLFVAIAVSMTMHTLAFLIMILNILVIKFHKTRPKLPIDILNFIIMLIHLFNCGWAISGTILISSLTFKSNTSDGWFQFCLVTMIAISWVSAVVGFVIILVIVWGIVKCLFGRCCYSCLKAGNDAGRDYKDLGKRQKKKKPKKDQPRPSIVGKKRPSAVGIRPGTGVLESVISEDRKVSMEQSVRGGSEDLEDRLYSDRDFDFGDSEILSNEDGHGERERDHIAFGDIVIPVFDWWREFGDAEESGDAERADPMHENFHDSRLFFNDVKTADETADSDLAI
jgi:hypothetical protein